MMSLHPYYRPLGNTGITVSPLGLGTVKLGRDKAVKYPQGFTIPDDKQALELLAQAWDLGINLIDTAPAYGNSEVRLGQLLPQLNHPWVIATKVGEYFDNQTGQSSYNFSPEHIQASVHQSLNRLNVEVLDVVLIHSDGHDVEIIQSGAIEVLNDLKKQGLIRASGMSTKTVEGGLMTLQQADVAMVMHHLDYQEEQAVIDDAVQRNKGILVKKALGSGHLAQSDNTLDWMQQNFDFIYQSPAVSSIIVGTITPTHLADNVAKVAKALSNTKD
jgi:aryl-alcohol dehydrogenase-like predicted oxidoreductase